MGQTKIVTGKSLTTGRIVSVKKYLNGFRYDDLHKYVEPVRISLNPTVEQMQKIKCEHLKQFFERTGITPAMKFYGTGIGVIDWLEYYPTYLDKAKYKNNVERN